MAVSDAQRLFYQRTLAHADKNGFTLRKGSTGKTVRALQLFLADQGFDPQGADGVFGDATNTALKAYQAKAGSNKDGVAGSRTFKAITADLGNAPAPAAAPVPKPNLRPAPDVLGTGNADSKPRLRPTDSGSSLLTAQDLIGPPPTSGPRQTMAPLGGFGPDLPFQRPTQPGGGLMGLDIAQLNDARANLNPDVQFNPGSNFDNRLALAQTGNARTREAQAITGPLKYQQRTGPPQVGTMIDTPFADRWNDTNQPAQQPPMQAPPQIAQQPQFQPTPDNPGYGLPGMPPRSSFGQAAGDVAQELLGVKPAYGGRLDVPSSVSQPQTPQREPPFGPMYAPPTGPGPLDWLLRNNLQGLNAITGTLGIPPIPNQFPSPPPAESAPYPQPATAPNVTPNDPAGEMQARQALEKAIWDALIGLRIQPQPNQPAYSDDFSTATQPPAFTSPMGPYR